MPEIGLTLGGGGAKGAYQIGAWRAICEYGLDKYIKIYSGSSIGAINCALIQFKDWEEVSEIWLNYNLNSVFLTEGVDLTNILKAIQTVRSGKKLEFNGLFSRDGLIDLLNKIGIENLENEILDFYVTVTNITELPAERRSVEAALNWYNGKNVGFTQYIYLKNADKRFIVDMLLATSAIPVLYPPEEIGGQYYVDGGINDNLPITPIFRRGFKKIIAISCERVNYANLKRRFPSADILLIQPTKYLGNLIDGTFNFNSQKLIYSYKTGYNDAVRAIKKQLILN